MSMPNHTPLTWLDRILYCVSLGIMSISVYRYRKIGLLVKHSNGRIDSCEVAKTE